jgi:site-specific DNA-methyltransferase (adenine-specific)
MRLRSDKVIFGENLEVIASFGDASFRMIYIDPPFNTGQDRTRTTFRSVRDESGPAGFGGRGYRSEAVGHSSFPDTFRDHASFMEPRLREARRLLDDRGTLYLHLDYREAHRCKLLLDEIFGPECFLNEIIWAYDYGGKPKSRWPAKHDTILVYVRDPRRYLFDASAVEREPYMAPGLVGAEKAARGKLPTDVWWHTIVPTTGREKTGYPTQKPEGIIRRMVQASTEPGDWCLDFFAGSGTLGAVCAELGRHYVLVDSNPEAIEVMEKRLGRGAALAA